MSPELPRSALVTRTTAQCRALMMQYMQIISEGGL
jgi:hypothetical protein